MNKTDRYITKLFSVEGLIVLYFMVLLLFGRSFTKFNIIGPVYLHDLVLLGLTFLALNRGKMKWQFPAIAGMILISLVYLVLSFLLRSEERLTMMIFRHYFLFIYLICSYCIYNVLVRDPSVIYKPLWLIITIAKASIVLQIIFLVYGYLFIPGFSLFNPLDYNYFSPLTVFGIIVYGGYILAYKKNEWLKMLQFLLVAGLSTTLGHSSAFFALFIILIVYLFIRIKPYQRIIAMGFFLAAILVLLFLPQFRDVNASWRLLYWKHVLQGAVFDRYLLFGNGFGKPYMTREYGIFLYENLQSTGMLDERFPMARYLSPPHNSILTIFFNIGIIPGLLFFVPLKNFFRKVFIEKVSPDRNANFLILALAGCLVWILFNVILELPHSATFFWLVYFTCAGYLKKAPAHEND